MYLSWSEQYLELSPPLSEARPTLVLLSLVSVGDGEEAVEQLGQVHSPDDENGDSVT